MNFYCDIKVLADPELSEPALMSNLFAKLHRALVQLPDAQIGISYPKVRKTLGDILRLHGSETDLKALMELSWLKGLRDYCAVGEALVIPEGCQYRVVRRKQHKSAHNKRKRSVAKGWLTEEQAMQTIKDSKDDSLKLPFVQFKSGSTDQAVKLFIKHEDISNTPKTGLFNRFGLSKTATIPWF